MIIKNFIKVFVGKSVAFFFQINAKYKLPRLSLSFWKSLELGLVSFCYLY